MAKIIDKLRNIFSSHEENNPAKIISRIKDIDSPTESEQKRIENYQLATSIAVITTYIRSLSSESSVFAPISEIIGYLAVISLLLLILRILIVTLQPIWNPHIVSFADIYVIPILFAISFLGGSSTILYSIIDTPSIDGSSVLNSVAGILELLLIGRFNWIYFVVLFLVAAAYGVKSGNSMPAIDSGVPEVKFTYTSSAGDESLPLTIHNGLTESIAGEDIRIRVSSPEEVDVKIPGAFEEIGGREWSLLAPVKNEAHLQLEFYPADDSGVEEREVLLTVSYRGQEQSRHKISVEG